MISILQMDPPKDGSQGSEAFQTVSEFWNNPESTSLKQNLIAEDYHFDENELFIIDDE